VIRWSGVLDPHNRQFDPSKSGFGCRAKMVLNVINDRHRKLRWQRCFWHPQASNKK
jgi:hypothetical protein